MISHRDPTYIVNGNMSADIVGPWIHCTAIEALVFHASWSAVAATSGSFSLEGTSDPTQAVVTSPLPWTDNGTMGSPGATAGNEIFAYVRGFATDNNGGSTYSQVAMPEWVRLKYTRGAGGGANQLQVWVIGRS